MNDDEAESSLPAAAPDADEVTVVMRRVLDELELHYDYDACEDVVSLRVQLENVEVAAFLYGRNEDLAGVILRMPVRVPEDMRPAVGEFLHRLNFSGKRKFWEMDYNDGEVRLRVTTDTIVAPLTDAMFRAMGRAALEIADRTFPYLNAVICRSMRPDFASDQAVAALESSDPGEAGGADGDER